MVLFWFHASVSDSITCAAATRSFPYGFITILSYRRTDQYKFQGDVCDCQRLHNAAHINYYCTFLSTHTLLQSVWAFGLFERDLLLGQLDKTQSESRKWERKMSDKCLESEANTTAAAMETQRGAKAPLISSLSQAFAYSPPLQISCAASHGVGWAHVDHRGSPKDAHTNKRSSLEKPVFSQHITLAPCLLKSSVALHSAAQLSSSFHQGTYYSLHHDLTSAQTSSLCLSWKVKVFFHKGYSLEDQIIYCILIL